MSGATEAVVVTRELSKWYGRVVGINEFSLRVGPGVTGLLGPNGAGKSTFIKLLSGALRPSRGELSVFGQPVWGNRRLMARLGYCPEHDGVYDELSGLEFVATLARLGGMGKAEAFQRGAAAMARMGLSEAQDRPVGHYSKGMRQRTKLAQALVHDPDLLLLDEPLTGCDPLARVQITQIIKELGAAGKAVIVSSHILHEVEAMTSEIILVYQGQVLAEGNIYRIREMIDAHPHQIRVCCDRPRLLARELAGGDHVRSLRFVDAQTLEVETREPDICYPLIPRLALEHGVQISALTSPDNNLQAVFRYLTRDRGAAGGAS